MSIDKEDNTQPEDYKRGPFKWIVFAPHQNTTPDEEKTTASQRSDEDN